MKANKEQNQKALEKIAFSDEHSRPIDVHKWSDYLEVQKLVESITDELKQVIPENIARNPKKYANSIRVLLLDLYVAYWQGDKWVGYPRTPKNYGTVRLDKLHISGGIIVIIIDNLKKLGYVRTVLGKKPKGKKKGKQSRVQANDRLVALFIQCKIKDWMICRTHHGEIYLRHKTKNGKKIQLEIEKTPHTRQLRADVQTINDVLLQAEINLPLTKSEQVRLQHRMGWLRPGLCVELFGTSYRRIFNDDLEHGGRWYGHWCLAIPSEYRQNIKINGEPTVELDYSGLHIRMLYDLDGIPQPNGDMYNYPGCIHSEDARTIRKIILQAVINAKKLKKACKGAAKSIRESDSLRATDSEISQIADKLMERHYPISDSFCSGMGLTLQYEDSEVARGILMDLAAMNIPCLPVHDSFIVQTRHEALLKKLMVQHYNARLGNNPVIDRKVKGS